MFVPTYAYGQPCDQSFIISSNYMKENLSYVIKQIGGESLG